MHLAALLVALSTALTVGGTEAVPPPIETDLCAQGRLELADCSLVDPQSVPGFQALAERTRAGRFPEHSLNVLERQLAGLLIEAQFPQPARARCFAGQSLEREVRQFADTNRYFFAGARELGCAGVRGMIEAGKIFYAKPQACGEPPSAACIVGAIELRLVAPARE